MGEAIFNQPHFHDEDKAREYLEALRWPNGIVCPHCGLVDRAYALKGEKHRTGLYKCGDCRKQFTVTVGTVFERSKIKLNVWLQAVHLMCASKKGISSKQLERMMGVTYKTAWFMSHRIREAMTDKPEGLLGAGGKVVEADETYWGNSKRSKIGRKYKGRGGDHKEKIVALVERNGDVRSFHVKAVNGATLRTILKEHVAVEANLMTDELPAYKAIGKEFASHEAVKHSAKEYARGNAHTNTIEGYFSILKRGLIGTFHHVGRQHLKRYVKEFDFRYNARKTSDTERTALALQGIGGKRLLYRHTLRPVKTRMPNLMM
ncbi:MAG: IS1595 family transposase [Casimicrobium sp.]